MKTTVHSACTTCAQAVHRFGIYAIFAFLLASCAQNAPTAGDPSLIRNPTVPIGAILRFDAAKFDGDWSVHSSAGGAWALNSFTVSDRSTAWREPGRTGVLTPRATGIFRLTYSDGTTRDLWVIWTDPDHHTVALGNPDGDLGFIATQVGKFRRDQVAAAAQVLDFNGYRTREWAVRAQ